MKYIFSIVMIALSAFITNSAHAQLRLSRCTNCPDNQTYGVHTGMSVPPDSSAFSYGDPITFPVERTAEDFGQRTFSTRCWHTGIDLNTGGGNTDLGDAIFPLDTGRVLFVKGGGDYKVVCLEKSNGDVYALGHLFYNGGLGTNGMRCGNFILKALENNTNNYGIVYFDIAGVPMKAYANVDSATIIVKNNYGNDTTLYTTTAVSTNVPVAPLGMSDAPGGAHIHFYHFKSPPSSYAIFEDQVSGSASGFGSTKFRQLLNPAKLLSTPEPDYTVEIPDSKLKIKSSGADKSSMVAKVVIPTDERVGAKRYTTLGAAEEVRFLIKKQYSDDPFSEIKGRRTYSHLSLGGIKDSTRWNANRVSSSTGQRYPSVGNPFGETEVTLDIGYPLLNTSKGSYTKTGIVTNQYNDANGTDRGADYYYFSDFYHRIIRGHNPHAQTASQPVPLARHPEEAEYPDGRYVLRAELETVERELAASSPTDAEFTIDNFRPFIKSVTIRQQKQSGLFFPSNEATLYEGSWEWRETPSPGLYYQGSSLDPMGMVNYGETTHPETRGIFIEVQTSEPMQSLQIDRAVPTAWIGPFTQIPTEIPANRFTQHFPASTTANDDGSDRFVFFLKDGDIGEVNDGFHTLNFSGKDLSGNNLLGMDRSQGAYSIPDPLSQIPVRTGDNSFSLTHAETVDKIHGFMLQSYCGPGKRASCLEVAIATPSVGLRVPINTKVIFNRTASGGKAPYSQRWNLGDGTKSTSQSPVKQYSNPGLYKVSVLLQDAEGLFRTSEPLFINVYDPANLNPVAQFQSSTTTINQGGDITFTDRSYGGTPPYSYSWAFSQATPSLVSAVGPHTATFNQVGKHDAELIITDAQGKTDRQVVSIEVKPATQSLSLEVRTIPELDEATFRIMDSQTGAEAWLPGYMVDWNFGDGVFDKSTFATSIRHAYGKGGIYRATARVKHFFGTEIITLNAEVKLWPVPEPEIIVDATLTTPGPNQVMAGISANFTADMSKALPPPGYYHEYEWVFENKQGNNHVLPYDRNNQKVQYTYSKIGERNRVWVRVRTRNATGTLVACGGIYGVSKCQFYAYVDIETKACQEQAPLPRQTWLVNPRAFEVHGGYLDMGTTNSKRYGVEASASSKASRKKISVPVGFYWEDGSVDFRSYSHANNIYSSDSRYNNRLNYEYEMGLVKMHYTGMSMRTGPIQVRKPTSFKQLDYSEDYLVVGRFDFDWDEFQKAGNSDFLYYAIITIREKGCKDAMTIVKQVCLSSPTHIVWNDVYKKDEDVTLPFGLDANGNGTAVTQFPDTLHVTDYMIGRYQNMQMSYALGHDVHSSGKVKLDSSLSFHFKADEEIVLNDEFEVLPGGTFTAYIEQNGPIFYGCNNYTGYVRQGGVDPTASTPSSFFRVVPNPMRSGNPLKLAIEVAQSQQVELEVFTLDGKLLLRETFEARNDQKRYGFDGYDFKEGLYMVRLYMKDGIQTQQFLVLNN
ncbi:MAG: PKD domain-containing protein [Bacteroidia bacterium]